MAEISYTEVCGLAADMLEKDLKEISAKYDKTMDEQDGGLEFRVALAALGSILEMIKRLRTGSLEDRVAALERGLQKINERASDPAG
jgi:hypothetical protein